MDWDAKTCALCVAIVVLILVLCGKPIYEGVTNKRVNVRIPMRTPYEGYSDAITSASIHSSSTGFDKSIGVVGGIRPRTFHSKHPAATIYGRGPMVGGIPSTLPAEAN